MAEDKQDIIDDAYERDEETLIEDQDGLSDQFIREIIDLIDEEDKEAEILSLCESLSAPDAAELIGKLDRERRNDLVRILEGTLEPETFSYLNYEIRNELLDHMSPGYIATIVNGLESDDAINLVNDLDESRRNDIMRHLSRRVRAAVEEGLNFAEESAGRLMQREFVAVPQSWTVGKTVDYLRAAADALPNKFFDIFIVDPMHRLVGTVALDNILCTQRNAKMSEIMNEEDVVIPVQMDQEQVARIFRKKDLLSAPVVDEDDRLIGVITVDDIVDVIDQEAEEDLLKLGGVADSDIFRSPTATARARMTWLLVNLFTAFISASVIGLFEESIEKIVALAILMPIVASMGGNAGTQAMTVAVRALATNQLSSTNAWRVIGKECLVGLMNGTFFAILLGLVVTWYFKDPVLGAIIGTALVTNLLIAGFFGAAVPITLSRLGLDPAPAAGVVLTTITDVVGFCAFLGLATLMLL